MVGFEEPVTPRQGQWQAPPSAEDARFGGGFRVFVSVADGVKAQRTGQKK